MMQIVEISDTNHSLILARSKRNGPEQKRTKLESQEEKVKQQLEVFVDSFIIEFSKRLVIYHITAKGGRLSAETLKAELKTGTTSALVGVAIAQNLLGSLPSIVTSVRSLSSQYYLAKEKAQKITKAFEQVAPGDLSPLLADAAVETFQSFESQFMQVTDKAGDKMAMEKLAEDAAARALNYIAANAKDNLPITCELITKGIVLGKSEKFFDPSIKNVRIRISGSILQDANGKDVNTVNLYEKVGLMIVGSESNQFYKKNTRPDSAQYGYRRLFSWESLDNGELNSAYQSEYEQEVFPRQETTAQYNLRRYEYVLQAADLKQESKLLLDKIKNRYLPIVEAAKVEQAVAKNILFDLRKPVTNFVGRKKVLEELHKTLLSTRNTAVISQAMSGLSVNSATSSGGASSSAVQASVSGLGGIGKTQLALRYAENYAADYDNNVLWINAESKGDLANSVRKLSNKLNIETKDRYGIEKEIEEILEEVYAYFSSGKSLFIFDNVENYREFEKFLPKALIGNKPALLITSRYRNWGNVASVIALDVLTEEEAKELIMSGLNIPVHDQSQDKKIKELTDLLQGLPLALQQAVAYINIQRNINIQFSIQDYLELYKAKTTEILDFDFPSYSSDPYAKTVFTTWQITLDKISQDRSAGEKALEILNIMAYICPDDIANNFFLPLEHSEKLALAIYLLKSYSMINEGSQQDKSTIHRLVQKVTRLNLEKDQPVFKETVEKILKLTAHFDANREIEFHYLHVLLHMNLHVELTEALHLRATRKRILDIITYSEFDVSRLLYLLDTAYMVYSREEYLKFIGEAIFVYTRYPFLLLLAGTMDYLEERLEQGIISKADIRKILDYKFAISDKHYRLGRLSPLMQERERQLDAVRLVYEFEEKLFPSSAELSICPSEKRKKRSAGVPCLRSGQEPETTKKQLQYQRIKQHLENVSRVARLVSSGLFTKDTLSALLQGDLNTVAINFSLLASSTILGEVSNSLLTQGEILTSADASLLLSKKLSLNGKLALSILTDEEVITAGKRRFLGNAMKMASPFVEKFPSFVFVYNLKNQIKEYRAGNKAALPGIISNGAIVGIDGFDSGVKAAEYVEVIEVGLSEFTGPFGDAAIALIWLGSDIKHVNDQLTAIEKYVHLSEEEKVIQDVRAFFHFAPSDYIEAKASNNQRVQNAINFLKKNTQIKRTIFSLGSVSSEVFLDKKIKITLDETMPDDPSEGSLFCLFGRSETHVSSSQWIPIVPYPPFIEQDDEISTYLCKNAIGVEYSLNRTESYTLIALDEGNHTVKAADTPNIFLVSNGKVNYTGGNAGNLFLLQGNSTSGMLKGGNGVNNKIKLENFNQNTSGYVLADNQGFICGKNGSDGITAQQCGSGLKIDNIKQMDGRKNKQDIIYMTEKLEYIDSYAGEDNNHLDHIYITDKSNKNPKLVLRNNAVVHAFGSNESLESINYRIPNDETGATQVELLFTDPTSQRFYFDFSIEDLKEISILGNNVTFNLLAQDKTFNVIILDPFRNLTLFHDKKMKYPECPINAYYLFKDAEIKVLNRNNVYAQLRSNRTVDEIVSHYPAIASRFNMPLSIRLQHNETVLIGHKKHQILYNNALAKTHLIGNGAENIYVITAATNTDKFPVPEVTLYKVHEDLTDTLDLRRVVQQAKQDCPEQEILLSVFQHQQDLVITLNAHYYLVSNSCIRLMTTWSIASVRLRKALLDNWYQNMDIILHNIHIPMNIIAKNGFFDIVDSPLVFDKDKKIIALTDTELEKESEVIFLKKMGRYSFIRNNDTDLILSNALDSNTTQRDLCTIIFSQFYQASAMQEKVLSTTLTFLDQQIALKSYAEQINNATSFDNIIKQYPAETYSGALNQTNTSRPTRHKRQVDYQVAMASEPDVKPIWSPYSKNPIQNRLSVITRVSYSQTNLPINYEGTFYGNTYLGKWIASLFAPSVVKRIQKREQVLSRAEKTSDSDWAFKNLQDGIKKYGRG